MYINPYNDFDVATRTLNYRDALGNIIERNEHEYPYSFSNHCTWVASHNELAEAEKLTNSGVIYSDRMFEAAADKYNQACRDIFNNQGQNFSSRLPKDIEKMLRLYFDTPSLVLTHIYKSCNVSNGFPIWAFTYCYK